MTDEVLLCCDHGLNDQISSSGGRRRRRREGAGSGRMKMSGYVDDDRAESA